MSNIHEVSSLQQHSSRHRCIALLLYKMGSKCSDFQCQLTPLNIKTNLYLPFDTLLTYKDLLMVSIYYTGLANFYFNTPHFKADSKNLGETVSGLPKAYQDHFKS